jgi:hypothetical protein
MLGHLGNVLGLDKVGGVHKGWWSRMDGCHNGPKNTLLHIVPFCEGPNKKSEGFAKEKQKT